MNKIGLLIPITNLTVEYELQKLINENFFESRKTVFYIQKLKSKTRYLENKEQFLKEISLDEDLKVKDLEYLKVDYIYSFCTSASLVGKTMLNNPADAIIEDAKDKKIKECMLITPYNDSLGKMLVEYLLKNNIKVNKNINMDLKYTHDFFNFGMKYLKKIILKEYKKEYKDIIISCTNLPTIHVINELESILNCRIISSNSSMFNKIYKEVNIGKRKI